MNVLIAIADGVPAALLATVITVSAVRMLPPRIEISRVIAVRWSDDLKELRQRFEIVNKSRRTIVDLRFELVILYPTRDDNFNIRPILRERSDPMWISGRRPRKKNWGSYTIAYGEDLLDEVMKLETVYPNRCRLRLRVFGRDSLTGTGRQFERKYEHLLDHKCPAFRYGRFKSKGSLEIEAEIPHQAWLNRLAQFAADVQSQTATAETPADRPLQNSE